MDTKMQAAQATLRQRYWIMSSVFSTAMQAAQATVQGKSKRLPQGRKYLNALKSRTNGTNYENAKTPRLRRGVLLSGDQIFVTILMPGPMVDAVTQDLMYWPFAAAGLALMIAPMSAL